MLKDFRTFITRGNVLDLAVAFILGAAFTTIVKSLVSDILMPPIGLIFGDVDLTNAFVVLKEGATAGPYETLAAAQEAGAVTLNYGVFIDAVIAFLLVAFALFMLVRYATKLQNLRKREEAVAAPTTKTCQFCDSRVSINATRCAYCTSQLSPQPVTT